jgi:cell division protein FtsN
MPKDYAKTSNKNRRNAKTKKKSATPTWMWFAAVIFIILFISGIIYSHKYRHFKLNNSQVKQSQTVQQAQPAHVQQPRFEFYSMLKNSEPALHQQKNTEPMQAKHEVPVVRVNSASLPSAGYIVQIASFKQHEAADKLKAKLTLEGMSVDIIKPSQRDSWYRITAGPYKDKKTAQQIQSQLTKSGYKTILKKAD